MPSEKDQLIDFTFTVMRECGMEEYFTDSFREMWQRAPMSGIREATLDTIEQTQDLQGDELAAVDSKLESHDLPTLTSMRNKAFRKTLRILSSGKIRNEDEWRTLRAFVDDIQLDDGLRQQAMSLLDDFDMG